MLSIRAGLMTGLLIALAAPVAHADTTAFVRVEGQTKTLLQRTAVSLPTTGTESNTSCPNDSASSALEQATKGNWDRAEYTKTILGETHSFANSDYWALWVFRGGRFVVANGACTERLAPGEELLAGYQVAPAPDYAPQQFPLWLTGVPATAKTGVPFTITVNKAACDTSMCNPGEGHRVAGAGATVTAGGASAIADAGGKATLTLPSSGATTIRATATGGTPSAAEPLCVTNGADGACGTTPPGAASPTPTPTPDTTAPRSGVRGIRDGRVFTRRKHAPRTLRVRVRDASGLRSVELGLTRRRKGECTQFSDAKGRFVKGECGEHPRFAVGTKPSFSYLLPDRLKRGRYTVTVRATDTSGNRERLVDERNRVVFYVR